MLVAPQKAGGVEVRGRNLALDGANPMPKISPLLTRGNDAKKELRGGLELSTLEGPRRALLNSINLNNPRSKGLTCTPHNRS
jgi:hypothetical protein